jgi:hypothetical protein
MKSVSPFTNLYNVYTVDILLDARILYYSHIPTGSIYFIQSLQTSSRIPYSFIFLVIVE